jgi:hypothetical protein
MEAVVEDVADLLVGAENATILSRPSSPCPPYLAHYRSFSSGRGTPKLHLSALSLPACGTLLDMQPGS